MDYAARRVFRSFVVMLSIFIIYCFSARPARAQITMEVFVDPHPVVTGGTIGFTYAGNKFVGSVDHDGLGALYATDLDGTNVRLFAPNVKLPTGSISSEHPVASSFGLGGFPSRDIYVGAASEVLHVTNDGTKSDVFVTGLAAPVRGIMFDLVGTFGHDMLVTTLGGQVYRVNSTGAVELLASLGQDSEGMAIAPLGGNFGSFDGQLIVSSERSGLLRAISPTGKVSVLNASNPIPWAEMVSFVPLDLGGSGSPVEGLYEANWTVNVVKGDRKEFMPFKGDLIVSSELFGRISRVHWDGSSFDITVVGAFPNQAEDGVFVTPTMINPVPGCPAASASAGQSAGDQAGTSRGGERHKPSSSVMDN